MNIDWKEDKNGILFIKHSGFRIEPLPHHSFSEMVKITKGPSYGTEIIGKRYINIGKAVGAVILITGDRLASKTSKEESEENMAIREQLIVEGYVEL